MPGKQHISDCASSASAPKARREAPAPDRGFTAKLEPKSSKVGLIRGADVFQGKDHQNYGRIELPQLAPFVGLEAVSEYLQIDPETAVSFARLGSFPRIPCTSSGT